VFRGIYGAMAPDRRSLLIHGRSATAVVDCVFRSGLYRYDPTTHTIVTLTGRPHLEAAVSSSFRRTLFTTREPGGCGTIEASTGVTWFLDAPFGAPIPLPAPIRLGLLSDSGAEVVFDTDAATALPPGADSNGAFDVFAADLDSRLDNDADGLDDRWEAATGLSYTSAAMVDGPAGDPDGDGLTNLQELQAGSHPRGAFVRLLAEGADNAFFRTRVALVNAGAGAATAVVRFLGDGGGVNTAYAAVRARLDDLVPRGRIHDRDVLAVLPAAEPEPNAGDRGRALLAAAGAAHQPNICAARELAHDDSRQHPGARTGEQRRRGGVRGRSSDRGRTRDVPVAGRTGFAAGHDSAGVTAAATVWWLAEGATGAFFDMFILIANPSSTDAEVEARYMLSSGQVVTKTYAVPANSRRTVWVDGEEFPGLGRALTSVDVSTALTSTNGVPIVVERTMWFPGPDVTPAFWMEATNSAGAVNAATRWVVADGETGGGANAKTYVLVANTSAFDASVRVTTLPEDGIRGRVDLKVAAHSRQTVEIGRTLGGSDARYGVLVESLGPGPLADWWSSGPPTGTREVRNGQLARACWPRPCRRARHDMFRTLSGRAWRRFRWEQTLCPRSLVTDGAPGIRSDGPSHGSCAKSPGVRGIFPCAASCGGIRPVRSRRVALAPHVVLKLPRDCIERIAQRFVQKPVFGRARFTFRQVGLLEILSAAMEIGVM
jgi:hypothetical protein